MKTFIVDIGNCLELSHYETFFYKNIKEGNLSLYKETLTSFDQLDLIYNWLVEEINRNPFSITKGLVVFYIPRDFNKQLGLFDIDVVVKAYIQQYIERKLDSRFKYVCVFRDNTDMNRENDATYKLLRDINYNFSSEMLQLQDGLFPVLENEDVSSLERFSQLINNISDPIMREFYLSTLNIEINHANLEKNSTGGEKAVIASFFQNCNKRIQQIHDISISHFGGDIAQKTEELLKLICYVCDTAQKNQNINADDEFEKLVSDFINKDKFREFDPKYENVKKVIVTYKSRLRNWLQDHDSSPALENLHIDELSYNTTDEAELFTKNLNLFTSENIRKEVLNPTIDELDSFDAADRVFSKLESTLANARKELKKFGDNITERMFNYRQAHPDYRTEEARLFSYKEDEIDNREAILKEINQYTTNNLPGYSDELKLRQELDIINMDIQYIARMMKKLKPKLFIGTLIFAIITILSFYVGTQYSIFMNEKTWWVPFVYTCICGLFFILSYFLLRRYYKRRLSKLLDLCEQKVNEFLESFKARAAEFEKNINASMTLYCYQDYLFKLSHQRHDTSVQSTKFQWHKLKIKAILINMSFFDGFTKNVDPVTETHIPQLDPYDHDAENCDFYQMTIFA